jgi:flagellar biosynthetic protein FlhB
VASAAQVGFLWTTQPLVPDLGRFNPAAGLSRLFGPRGLVEAVKALLKVLVVGWVVYTAVRARLPDLVALGTLPTPHLLTLLGTLLYTLALRVSLVFLVIALLDYAYQRWDYEKSLKMSKEEIKQEHKQSEGDPLIKGAIRQRQRDAARKRMMQDVPKADVVITNPTHVAIALAYDVGAMRAPQVLAKGQDELAARIRELAAEHDIPFVENPPLARTLYKQVEIGQEIPAALYAAVAEVLAYVYERNRKKALTSNCSGV